MRASVTDCGAARHARRIPRRGSRPHRAKIQSRVPSARATATSITIAGHRVALQQQWGVWLIAASLALVVVDAELATRSRSREKARLDREEYLATLEEQGLRWFSRSVRSYSAEI
jgi:hypothetical protein